MASKKNILAICGSIRKKSSNLYLIEAIKQLTTETFNITYLEGLAELPHFNPDLEDEKTPVPVLDFRKKIREADGVLICTPEYAMGVPGTLKNAIDWTVYTMEFSKKPVALITASFWGEKAHLSLLGTLLIIEAHIAAETQIVIPFIRTKVKENGIITDNEVLFKINKLIISLLKIIANEESNLLEEPILMIEGWSNNKG